MRYGCLARWQGFLLALVYVRAEYSYQYKDIEMGVNKQIILLLFDFFLIKAGRVWWLLFWREACEVVVVLTVEAFFAIEAVLVCVH